MEKICPLTKEVCNPTDISSANKNCTFYEGDMFKSSCIYIEAMKSLPAIAENIKRFKAQV
ncbi:MAG: hypothetical protein ACP5QT_07775 [Brevinematia bacterium]